MNLKKILQSAGINLEEMQTDAKKVPALLEALVKQNNAQVKAIKEILEGQATNESKLDLVFKKLDSLQKNLSS